MARSGWTIALASVVGTSHVKTGTPCQDASKHILIGLGEGAVLACVVCDGAGSSAHSEVGSALAACAFTELVEIHFDRGGTIEEINQEVMTGWLYLIAEDLARHAEQFERAARDYACTLLCAVVGATRAAFAQVGDGAIVVSQGLGDGWSWVFWPQHGQFANTTNFITDTDIAKIVDFASVEGRIVELALFSDGLENLVLHHATRTVHKPFFERIMLPMRAHASEGLDESLSAWLRRYLDKPELNARTNDDKTLLLASRADAGAAGTK